MAECMGYLDDKGRTMDVIKGYVEVNDEVDIFIVCVHEKRNKLCKCGRLSMKKQNVNVCDVMLL